MRIDVTTHNIKCDGDLRELINRRAALVLSRAVELRELLPAFLSSEA